MNYDEDIGLLLFDSMHHMTDCVSHLLCRYKPNNLDILVTSGIKRILLIWLVHQSTCQLLKYRHLNTFMNV